MPDLNYLICAHVGNPIGFFYFYKTLLGLVPTYLNSLLKSPTSRYALRSNDTYISPFIGKKPLLVQLTEQGPGGSAQMEREYAWMRKIIYMA